MNKDHRLLSFADIIQNMSQDFVKIYNRKEFEKLRGFLCENIILEAETMQMGDIKLDEIRLSGIDEVINYWSRVSTMFDNTVSKYEFIELGRNMIILCYFDSIHLKIESHINLNEYGKIYRIGNKLVP